MILLARALGAILVVLSSLTSCCLAAVTFYTIPAAGENAGG